jgi:tetratricopeptide (TPR) repeat protein
MRKRLLLLILLTLGGLVSVNHAQETQKTASLYEGFNTGLELYQKSQFTAARIAFDNFINLPIDRNDPFIVKAYYYHGMSALNLYNDDAISLLERFNKNYPENPYRNQIYFEVANYHFQKEDYESAIPWYNQVTRSHLDSLDMEIYSFKKGYSFFQQNNYPEAVKSFKEVRYSLGQYGTISLYYYSHLSYMLGQWEEAKQHFHRLKHLPEFTTIAPYYIVQINHKQGLYDSVISYAPSVLDTADLGNYSDILHLLGDSYFKTNQFEPAAKYLALYDNRAKTTRNDDYQLGFSLMKCHQDANAISYLEKAARIDDSLGQSAMYQIGNCYLNVGKLLPARNAFERAANMKSNPILSEDALYQFAVISFKIDINPYDESVRAFEKYLALYPNSTRKPDIFQYLVNVYASTSNFAKALESLNKIPNKDSQLKSVYQTVAFNFGVDLFQKNQMDSAFTVFGWVEKYQEEPEIIAKSRYWRADVLFRKAKYKEAITEYKKFLSSPSATLLDEKDEAYYSMAYAYLELEQLTDALEHFGIYLQGKTLNAEKKLDAMFQLADGNYKQGKDEQAIVYYKQIISNNTVLDDRANFYLAKAYGYNKQPQLKITTLEGLMEKYPASKYIQNASYELAMSYKAQSEFEKAFHGYESYLLNYPKSPKVVNCRIEMADIYYKQWNYAMAESAYRSILLEYGNKKDICAVAAKGLMDVYVAMKSPERAEEVANEYDCAGLSADEKENLYFNPALQSYVDSNYSDATLKFTQYLTKYPNGKFSQDAHFYAGNAYLRLKDTLHSLPHYEAYLEGPVASYFEPVAYRISAYYYERKDYEKAAAYYSKLEQYAAKPANINAAKIGLMRCAFLRKDYKTAQNYANQVREIPGVTQNTKLEAEYALGMSAYYLNNYSSAAPSLEWIVKNTTTIKAAEAKYTLAIIQFKNSVWDSTLVLVKELLKMKPSYNYWVAMGLILETRVHIQQGNYLEAEQTISAVIDFYPAKEEDGILVEAQEIKLEIEKLKNPDKPVENDPLKTIEIKPE